MSTQQSFGKKVLSLLMTLLVISASVMPSTYAYAEESGASDSTSEVSEESNDSSDESVSEVNESSEEGESTDEEEETQEQEDETTDSNEDEDEVADESDEETTTENTDEEANEEETDDSETDEEETLPEASSTASSTPGALENAAEADGGNASSTPESQDGDKTEIYTGESVALANILNIINTNFINSTGVVYFSNFFDYVRETLDFRSLLGTSTPFLSGNGNDLNVRVSNNASIENDILVSALSGGNTIENASSSLIQTGNSYAGLNLINLANNNIIDSEYLLVTLNAFKDVDGDLVFPSLDKFIASLKGGAGSVSEAHIDNEAEVENMTDVSASSGDNTINDTNSSNITSGNSKSVVNVFNKINSTDISGTQFSILLRVQGEWAGEVFGAPEGVSWGTDFNGNIVLFENDDSGSGNGSITFNSENKAKISNNVSVMALTGDNHISNAEEGEIKTGDAFAAANIMNVANNNIVGKNWIMAIVNIFGDFKGNIAFGRPDLWVGETIEVPDKVVQGSKLNYKFSIINNGDSRATNVTLKDFFDTSKIKVTDSSHEYEILEDGSVLWHLEALPAGGATEVSLTAEVITDDEGNTIENEVKVASRETDNNLEDNTDTASVTTYKNTKRPKIVKADEKEIERKQALLPIENVLPEPKAILEIRRTSPYVVLAEGESEIEESLNLKNTTNATARSVIFHDVLRDSSGNLIKDEVWDLGDIAPYEEIIITYKVSFSPFATAGTYS
ncbi:MAG TPA: hypothetical protein VEC13_02985, partial [Candidatus Paceibacterota bacterium]|nr:hypothetical protein [Candidatus Paceibacterota bacterium]